MSSTKTKCNILRRLFGGSHTQALRVVKARNREIVAFKFEHDITWEAAAYRVLNEGQA